MTNGISTAESKSIQEVFKMEFDSAAFTLNPPAVDAWIANHVKSQPSHKSVENTEISSFSMHFKVMDIGTPLLHLYSQLATRPGVHADDPLMKATGAALQQCSRAFHYVSRRRRENVLGCASPRSKHLFEDPTSFSSPRGH